MSFVNGYPVGGSEAILCRRCYCFDFHPYVR